MTWINNAKLTLYRRSLQCYGILLTVISLSLSFVLFLLHADTASQVFDNKYFLPKMCHQIVVAVCNISIFVL